MPPEILTADSQSRRIRWKDLTYFLFFQSSALVPPTTLFDELSCTLRDDEHLLEELPSVRLLLSLLTDFLNFLCPEEKSCRIVLFRSNSFFRVI